MLIIGGAQANVPIEVKRHWNSELWQAASGQLQGYAAAPGAKGQGVYLVFWFGIKCGRLPPRQDGQPSPTSATELERMLVADLSDELRRRTKVFVFDVSANIDRRVLPEAG